MIGRVLSAGNGRLVVACDADEKDVCALAFCEVDVRTPGAVTEQERQAMIARLGWLAANADPERLRLVVAVAEAVLK